MKRVLILCMAVLTAAALGARRRNQTAQRCKNDKSVIRRYKGDDRGAWAPSSWSCIRISRRSRCITSANSRGRALRRPDIPSCDTGFMIRGTGGHRHGRPRLSSGELPRTVETVSHRGVISMARTMQSYDSAAPSSSSCTRITQPGRPIYRVRQGDERHGSGGCHRSGADRPERQPLAGVVMESVTLTGRTCRRRKAGIGQDAGFYAR